MILRFAALHGETRVGAVVVAGDVIVFESEDIERQAKANIFGAAHAETGSAKLLRLDEIRGLLDARWNIGADVRDGDAVHAGDKAEFADIDAQGGIFDLMLKQRAGEIGTGKAVSLRLPRRCQFTAVRPPPPPMACTVTVGWPGICLGRCFGEDARFDVGRATGGEVDDDV